MAGVRVPGQWIAGDSLLRRRTREFTRLVPLFGSVGHELAEVGRRACQRRAAQIGEPRLDIWIREPRIDFLVELVDDFGGRILGRTPAVPSACLVARHELSPGWGVLQPLPARRRRPPPPAQLAGPGT